MTNGNDLKQFDEWLGDDSQFAALVVREWLQPIEGKDAIIFPPTYAKPEGTKEGDWLGYNIDGEGSSSVCQIDSVGSQANRMEPIFKRGEYRQLVPQVSIKAITEGRQRIISLLDAGHRAADAIVRFSDLGPELRGAFLSYRDDGNAEPLARIAPTSIIFGAWDSRATQSKLPRIVRSVVRAYNVRILHRSAQYSTVAGEILDRDEVEVTTRGPKAELGLAHVPAVWTHGGIQVLGEIRRDAMLKLTTIRLLSAPREDVTLRLRRYILGLALVSLTAQAELFLREGCEFVPDPDKAMEWQLVKYDGTRGKWMIGHDQALLFAKASAESFCIQQRTDPAIFNSSLARDVIALSEKDRKKLLKEGPVNQENIEKMKKGKAISKTKDTH
ncbi:MAG: type I-U CRISPR-associated RAMP protein Csb1/Cas7u [Syntrophobacter sp.]